MSRYPALLNLLGLLIAVSCIGCGGGSPAEPAPSIAIECHSLALCPLDDFLCNEPPITVGDPVSCSISLRHVRSDEDRPDTPPRVFGQAEWAFLSDDLGVLHPSPAKPITGWFGGGLTNIAPEEDDSQRANTCRGANNARLASPVDPRSMRLGLLRDLPRFRRPIRAPLAVGLQRARDPEEPRRLRSRTELGLLSLLRQRGWLVVRGGESTGVRIQGVWHRHP